MGARREHDNHADGIGGSATRPDDAGLDGSGRETAGRVTHVAQGVCSGWQHGGGRWAEGPRGVPQALRRGVGSSPDPGDRAGHRP